MSAWDAFGGRRLLLALLPFLLVLVLATQQASPSLQPALRTAQVAPTAGPSTTPEPTIAPAIPTKPQPKPAPKAAAPADDLAGWTPRQLAAQLVLAGYDMSRTDRALPHLREGLGGVILFGRPPADIADRIARLRATGVTVPFIASDEEGGQVQRLRPVLGPLPSAGDHGRTRSPAQVRGIAAAYGAGMRRLGVDLDLGPVADLRVGGYYLQRTDRAFSADPATVGSYAGAWSAGMRSSRVVPVAKHWPGHGQADNTHDGPASTPPLAVLEGRDLKPFGALLRSGVRAVMVGHLTVPGLTEAGTPATLSPQAYRYLRARAGSRVLMTDSLSMGAIRSLGLSPAKAAVRALSAGADVVLVDPGPGPRPVVDAVAAAIGSGRYPRAAAAASVRRVLSLKRTVNPPVAATRHLPVPAAIDQPLTPVLSVLGRDRVGGVLETRFHVRTVGAPTWDVLNGAAVKGLSGTAVTYRLGGGRLRPGTTYEWAARSCNAAGLCAPLGPVLRFTTSV